jgi:hypothetical protein
MTLKIRCAHGHAVARRSVLTGFAAMLALAPTAARAERRVSDLVNGDGMALPQARALAGQTVRLRGYLSQSSDAGQDYLLTESPNGPCQLCGLTHDTGVALRVLPADGEISVSPLKVVELTGRLERQADIIRLVDARIATS